MENDNEPPYTPLHSPPPLARMRNIPLPDSPSLSPKQSPSPTPDSRFQLHTMLRAKEFEGKPARKGPLVWDMRDAPELARLPSNGTTAFPLVLASTLEAPASSLLQFSVRCFDLPFKREISAQDNGWEQDSITLQHLLQEIYIFLRQPVSEAELAIICDARPYLRQQALDAWQERILRSDQRLLEENVGVRRVDLLGRSYMFAGLAALVNDNACMLCTAADA